MVNLELFILIEIFIDNLKPQEMVLYAMIKPLIIVPIMIK